MHYKIYNMATEKCIRLFADKAQISECRRKVTVYSGAFSRLAHILSLAGNEVRLKILYLLEEEGKLCPCDMADILDMTIPAISQHLRKMKDGNIIKSQRTGQTIYYSLDHENLKVLKPLFKELTQTKKEMI